MKGNVSKAKGGGGGGGVTVADGKVYVKDGSRNIELVQAYQTYGVSIDLSNSNPETAVTYTDDAVGMVAGSPDWYKMSIFNKIKPCLFKNGAVVGYLNPDNFAQFADGTAADISSGDSGDVMIEIPKTGYKISKSGTTLTVQITDDPNKKGFSYKAHTRTEDGDREKLYIGAFLGSNKDEKLRSISGVTPLYEKTIGEFRTLAQKNGAGYDLLSFYPLTLLQCLYLIMYKNLNSQAALGCGRIQYTSYFQKDTGATIEKGMCYGSEPYVEEYEDDEGTSTVWVAEQMKFLGIEDFWGHLCQFIDGLVGTNDYHALVATDNFNDKYEGYTDLGELSTQAIFGGYMKEPQGTNEIGFIVKELGGSTTTYFADPCHFGNPYIESGSDFISVFGGCWAYSNAGAFRLEVSEPPLISGAYYGSRLMYL